MPNVRSPVSASGYYAWIDRPPSKRAREEVRLELEIKAVPQADETDLWPGTVTALDLAEHGVRVGIGRIKRIRKKLGIRCKQKRTFKATTQSRHRLPVARERLGPAVQAIYRPTAVWVTDITYVPTDEGWLYLAGHKDLFTGEIVGYAMGERLSRNLVSQSLLRGCSPASVPQRESCIIQTGAASTAPRSIGVFWNGLACKPP